MKMTSTIGVDLANNEDFTGETTVKATDVKNRKSLF